jgi:hypothetical protein
MLRPIRLQCAGVWNSAGHYLHMHIVDRVYLNSDLQKIQPAPDPLKRNYCEVVECLSVTFSSRGVSIRNILKPNFLKCVERDVLISFSP